ncbi:coagulation factor IX [Exaiptasia diaphana]|uniref:Peptidase S1 domain-containing protein n=1 Tax=Exaiptasia diaphana TaxID=2652724 RepID=A0A913XQ26_EXADI|nr:coagulation factor IX [Exaiptasia diaphana]
MKYLWLIALLGTIHASVGKPTGNNANCGKLPDLTTSKRIVGGNESQQGLWPWQAAVLFNNKPFCGGVIINEHWIATGARCLKKKGPFRFSRGVSSTNSGPSMDPKLLTVALGEHKLGVKESFEQIKNVQQIISHPHFNFSFDKNKLLFVDNDVALLKLSTPATFDTFVKPIIMT